MNEDEWNIDLSDDYPQCENCYQEIKYNEVIRLTEHNYGYAMSRPMGTFDYWCHNCLDKAPECATEWVVREQKK